MTNRDEQRAACIEAMARAAYHVMTLRMAYRHGANLNLDLFDAQPKALKEDWIASQAAAFDSMHGLARVCAVEATEEMRAAAYGKTSVTGLWRGMSSFGDLTNPPEKL